MNTQNRLLSLFNIYPGEGRLVLLVLLYAILLYTANVLARTASYALFLAKFNAANLPYAYIGVAVFATLISFIYLKLSERFSLSTMLIGVHVFLLLTLAGYRLGLVAKTPWLLFSLPIYFGLNNSLTISAFWNLLGRLYNLQQSKRLFGLLTSGEHIATIATGFMAPLLVAWLGTPNLFLVAALVMAGTLGLLIYIARANGAKLAEPVEEKPAGGQQKPAAESLLKDSYIVLIISVFTLFIVGIYFVDNIFYSQAEIQYPDEDTLANFISLFFGVFGVLSLLIQTFVTSRVLNRFGVRAMILATPAGLLITAILFALVGTFSQWLAVLFWLIATANMYRLVLDAVDSAAVNVLYQPLPPRQRMQIQTIVSGIVYPLAIGFTGLILLFFIDVLNFGPVQLVYVLVLITAAWLILALRLGRAYPRRLQQALSQRRLSDFSMPRPERTSLAIFQQGLASPQVGVVLYALDTLAEIAPETLVDCLPALLGHSEREVRLAALRQIEQLGLKTALPLVQERLKYEGSRPVQAASLRLLATLGGQEIFDQVSAYLEQPDPALKQGVLVGLLRSGELEGILLAGEKIQASIQSSRPEVREFAARVLGEGGIAAFYRPLLTLLRDDWPPVQQAALAAAGKLKHPNLWPAVIACLASPQTRSAAVATLVTGGQAVLPELEKGFAQAGQNRDVAIRLARICGRIGGAQALDLLRRHFDWPDVQVRSHILAALSQCGYRATEADKGYIHQALKAEVGQAAWTLAGLVDLEAGTETGQQDALRLLKAALNAALARQRERLFLWLSFVYDARTIHQVRDALTGVASGNGRNSGQQQDYALEIMEVLLPAELKVMLRPLIEAQTPIQRLQRLTPLFPQPSLTYGERLAEIMGQSSTWLNPWAKACALSAVSQLGDAELAGAVSAALDDPDPLVRESAVWTLARLDAGLYQRYIVKLPQDSNPLVARAIRSLNAETKGGPVMLTLVEKVMLLKTVEFFAEVAEEVLPEVAATLTELEVKAGETILTKDVLNNAMYLIVEGQVGLQNGRDSTSLGEKEVFGELALLNPATQPATITALTDTRLLCLNQAPLVELLEDHPQVAWGIIQRLAQRLQRVPGQSRAERARDDLLGGLKEKLTRSFDKGNG